MIIKQAEDQSASLNELERRAKSADPSSKKRLEEELRARRSGAKGEAESAYLIDFHFGESTNWAVIHDLRIEVGGQVAQIDHLMINRVLECYVLETKRFHSGVRINEEGEFERWNSFRSCYEGLPSPLLQNERHIEILKRAVSSLEMPTRLGLRLPIRFETLILVSPSARIIRPSKFDTSRVIKADQLKQRVHKDIDSESILRSVADMTKLVSSETVLSLGKQLASLHRPASSCAQPVTPPELVSAASTGVRKGSAHTVPTAASVAPPSCKKCGGRVGQVLYGQYGYYFKCTACAANTAVKMTCEPGHKPRLRKQGQQFLRECADCGISEVYFTNP